MSTLVKLKDLYRSEVYSTFTEVKDTKQYELFVKVLLKEYPDMKADTIWKVGYSQLKKQKVIGLFVYPYSNSGKGRYGICGAIHCNTERTLDMGSNKKAMALSYIKHLKE